ncbi:hypothetical protein EG329_000906, partial [Mollisiaceae sp. DMI_Dod_QoI]
MLANSCALFPFTATSLSEADLPYGKPNYNTSVLISAFTRRSDVERLNSTSLVELLLTLLFLLRRHAHLLVALPVTLLALLATVRLVDEYGFTRIDPGTEATGTTQVEI